MIYCCLSNRLIFFKFLDKTVKQWMRYVSRNILIFIRFLFVEGYRSGHYLFSLVATFLFFVGSNVFEVMKNGRASVVKLEEWSRSYSSSCYVHAMSISYNPKISCFIYWDMVMFRNFLSVCGFRTHIENNILIIFEFFIAS